VTDGAVITTTDYAGKSIYQNNALQFISQPEGYLELDGQGGYDYTYQYKDHLGNIRLSFMDSDGNGQIAQSEIKEENNYYPFGLKHSGYNMLVFSANLALKYKYNGKELQDELGLDWYDYGARKYDPALGRWHSVDPLAEAYSSYSSYNYTLNNPIRYIDPDGRWVKGAGLLRNIFKSDERIEAEDRVTEIGGDAEAHRNKVAGGWNVTYTSGEKVDLGNGDIELKTFNIENYSKKNRNVAAGGGGMSGLPENDFVKYSVEGTAVWAGTVQTGFDAVRKLQPSVSTWIKGAKVLGKTSNVLGVTSIGYDFATGNANSSTVADGLVMVGGAAVLFFGGVALAPWVAGAGVVYGIVSIAGGEKWLDRNIDISGYINFVKPSKP
jgi:RHS repeat-associated protein